MPTVTGATYDGTTLTITGTGFTALMGSATSLTVDMWDGTETIPAAVNGGNGSFGGIFLVSDTELQLSPVSMSITGKVAVGVVSPDGTAEYGWPRITRPGANTTSDPWWNHYSDPIAGTPVVPLPGAIRTVAGRAWQAACMGSPVRPAPCRYMGLSADAGELYVADVTLPGEYARVAAAYDHDKGEFHFRMLGDYMPTIDRIVRKIGIFTAPTGGAPLFEFLAETPTTLLAGIGRTLSVQIDIP
jgi:hypothetical protein